MMEETVSLQVFGQIMIPYLTVNADVCNQIYLYTFQKVSIQGKFQIKNCLPRDFDI